MRDAQRKETSSFLATIALPASELGLYAAVRQAKRLTNDQIVSAMVTFCLQLLVSEISTLSADESLEEDLERMALHHATHVKQLSSLLAGAEKILLDAAALREQLAREKCAAA